MFLAEPWTPNLRWAVNRHFCRRGRVERDLPLSPMPCSSSLLLLALLTLHLFSLPISFPLISTDFNMDNGSKPEIQSILREDLSPTPVIHAHHNEESDPPPPLVPPAGHSWKPVILSCVTHPNTEFGGNDQPPKRMRCPVSWGYHPRLGRHRAAPNLGGFGHSRCRRRGTS